MADLRRDSRRLWTVAGIAFGALLLSVLTIKAGIAGVARYGDPALALRWNPHDARALSAQAELDMQPDAPAGARARAEGLARAAIARDATLGTPYRILGFIAEEQGRDALVAPYLAHAEALSRRDLATQLWFINHAVARDDTGGALHHFDIALRTSDLAPTVLYPVLGNAIAEPGIVPPLAAMLAKHPPWRDGFLADAIDKSDALPGLVQLADALAARSTPLSGDQARALLNHLTEKRAFALAAHVRDGRIRSTGPVYDPGFDRADGPYPFGWSLVNTSDLSAERESNGNRPGDARLSFRVKPEQSGVLAQQLLVLKPGHYRITTTGHHDGVNLVTAPYWALSCGDLPPRPLVTLSLPVGEASQSAAADFDVPADKCTGQWLVLAARAADRPEGVAGWIDRLDVVAR